MYSTYIYLGRNTRATAVDWFIHIDSESVPTGEFLSLNEKLQMSLHRIVKEWIDMDLMAMVTETNDR